MIRPFAVTSESFGTRFGTAANSPASKAIVQHACAAEADFALAEMERLNALALASLTGEHNVKLAAFPDDLVDAARKQAQEVLSELAARNAITAKIHKSYADFRARTAPWSQVSLAAVLRARG